jgi:hypothetical protein
LPSGCWHSSGARDFPGAREVFSDWVWVQNVVFPLIGMGMGTFVLFGVYRIANKFIDRRHEARLAVGGPGAGEELRRLQQRIEQLEEKAYHWEELEERLEFAERMLAHHAQRPLIEGEH